MSRPHLFVLNERDPENPRAGGAEVHLFEILERLSARGFPVTMFCAGFPGAGSRARIRGVDVHRVGNRYSYYVRGPAAFRRLARAMVGPALLIETLNKLPFYGPLYSPIPEMAIVHHLFGTTAFRQVSFPIAAITYLAELGIPTVYRRVPMIAISPSTRDDLVHRGVPSTQVTISPCGIDQDVYRPGSGESGPMILALGRIEHYKGFELVVEVMPRIVAAVPDARLVIAGRGDVVPALERQVATLGLGDHVEFAGFVDDDRKVELYRSARVFVNPSEKEGWGLTVIEANACGAPVVASDSPGLRDAVQRDRSGLLYPHGDAEACGDAILRVLQDPETWRRLRDGGIEWAATFSWDTAADQTEVVIADALERHATVRGG